MWHGDWLIMSEVSSVIKYSTMKHVIISFAIILLLIVSLYGFRNNEQTSIIGRVNPLDGANSAWAVGGRDSATSNIVNGTFSFSVKPGMYKVVVDAVEPYKDAVLENISVKEGQTINLGEIMLQRTLMQKR